MLKLEKSFGKLDIKFKNNEILKFYQEGSSKAIIPNVDEDLNQMMLINTAGGITSGDNYCTSIELDKSIICTSTHDVDQV